MDILKYIFICVGGYLLGSVSISIILSRAFGVDIRKKGSGNAGATNMARSFGLLAGFATLAGDFLKALPALRRWRAIFSRPSSSCTSAGVSAETGG